MPPSSHPHRAQPTGFTLVELLIVIIIMGILGALAIPAASGASADSTGVALATNVRRLNSMVEFQYHASGSATYPETVDPSWFASDRLPRHPEAPSGVRTLEVVNGGGRQHPTDKILTSGSAGAFWYNIDAGVVRGRVQKQDSTQETLDYYNLVNGTQLTGLGGGATSTSSTSVSRSGSTTVR